MTSNHDDALNSVRHVVMPLLESHSKSTTAVVAQMTREVGLSESVTASLDSVNQIMKMIDRDLQKATDRILRVASATIADVDLMVDSYIRTALVVPDFTQAVLGQVAAVVESIEAKLNVLDPAFLAQLARYVETGQAKTTTDQNIDPVSGITEAGGWAALTSAQRKAVVAYLELLALCALAGVYLRYQPAVDLALGLLALAEFVRRAGDAGSRRLDGRGPAGNREQ